MSLPKPIRNALVSVWNKDGLEPSLRLLAQQGVKFFASGGTAEFLKGLGLEVTDVSSLTHYPAILGGRVKTLHPAVFAGLLARQEDAVHQQEMAAYQLPIFDLAIVDLYPFQQTLAETREPMALIEKIDVGGVALIRASAKNYNDVLIVPGQTYYNDLQMILERHGAASTVEERHRMAVEAFRTTVRYDLAIGDWLAESSLAKEIPLRYGENPHQQAHFLTDSDPVFEQLSGKELSYNNILDLDGAFRLMADFDAHTLAIFKHANPCGVASRPTCSEAWDAALASDPTSAFGGIIITGHKVDAETARKIDGHFYEILAAPDFEPEALNILKAKGKRILLKYFSLALPGRVQRSAVGGLLVQDADLGLTPVSDYKYVTKRHPELGQLEDFRFAEAVAKHLKSNAIAIVKNKQIIGAGMGQTSRIDALNQALEKAARHGFDLKGAVLASDGFFPFADSVAAAHAAGIEFFVQPGGSVKDQDSIAYCDTHHLCMIFTGNRHFRH